VLQYEWHSNSCKCNPKLNHTKLAMLHNHSILMLN